MSKKFKTWEVIKAITEDKSRRFKSRDYHGGSIECYYYIRERNEFIAVEYSCDGEIKELECNFGADGDGGQMTWLWEENFKPVTFLEAYQYCMVSKKRCLFRREDTKHQYVYMVGLGDGTVEFKFKESQFGMCVSAYNWILLGEGTDE